MSHFYTHHSARCNILLVQNFKGVILSNFVFPLITLLIIFITNGPISSITGKALLSCSSLAVEPPFSTDPGHREHQRVEAQICTLFCCRKEKFGASSAPRISRVQWRKDVQCRVDTGYHWNGKVEARSACRFLKPGPAMHIAEKHSLADLC